MAMSHELMLGKEDHGMGADKHLSTMLGVHNICPDTGRHTSHAKTQFDNKAIQAIARFEACCAYSVRVTEDF